MQGAFMQSVLEVPKVPGFVLPGLQEIPSFRNVYCIQYYCPLYPVVIRSVKELFGGSAGCGRLLSAVETGGCFRV